MNNPAFGEWCKEAERILLENYCIDFGDAGLESIDLEPHFGDSSPEEFVGWYAEKYDLVRRRDWINP